MKLTKVIVTQVDAHEKVGGGKVGDEEARHVDAAAAEDEHEHHRAVAEQCQQEHRPHTAAQRPPVEQVHARQERACANSAPGNTRFTECSFTPSSAQNIKYTVVMSSVCV